MAIRSPKKQGGFLSIDGVFWLMLIAVALGFILVIAWAMLGNSDTAIEQSNISTMVANTKNSKAQPATGRPEPIWFHPHQPRGHRYHGQEWQYPGQPVERICDRREQWHDLHHHRIQPAEERLHRACHKGRKDQKTTTAINGGSATTGEILGMTASTSCSSDTNTIAWTFF